MDADDSKAIWKLEQGEGAIVAAALHDGHQLRADVAAAMALTGDERLREEDPFTGAWTVVAPTRIIGTHSRFQVDLNRPREKAVYLRPEDAWGLQVWNKEPSKAMVERSLEEYDTFYAMLKRVFDDLVAKHGHFVVIDLHSYNHRREGPNGPEADPEANPVINLGTGSLDREFWAPVVDRFLVDMGRTSLRGRSVDIRENVRFRGGGFPCWVHERYPGTGCALAVEMKKVFMDEWTGVLDEGMHKELLLGLEETQAGIIEALDVIRRRN